MFEERHQDIIKSAPQRIEAMLALRSLDAAIDRLLSAKEQVVAGELSVQSALFHLAATLRDYPAGRSAVAEIVETYSGIIVQKWFADAFEDAAQLAGENVRRLRELPYGAYLQSPEWQAKRAAKLINAGDRCQVCNATGTDRKQLQVHHRTYERRGNEQMADLIVLCDGCHGLFHQRLQAAPTNDTPWWDR